MNPHDPLFAASQRVHGMAGESKNGKMAMVLTGLSVALVAVMVFKELKETLGDAKFKEWEHHNKRHEQTHAERVRQSQGEGRGR